MTRASEKKPPPPPSSGSGRSQPQKPARTSNTEAFGRFVRNLARLEGGSAAQGRGGERGR